VSGDVWYELLAVVPYAGLATWSLVVSGSFAAAVRVGGMSRHLLWGMAAFTLLATWFFGIAITGGSDPLISRRLLAIPMRLLAIVVLAAGCVWIATWARAHIIIEWRQRDHMRGING
jgi:hypothetical protein